MKLARNVIKRIANTSVFGLFAKSIESIPWRENNVLRVLTYHRVSNVDEFPNLDPSLISATPQFFERQMNWLARDFNPVSLAEVLAAIRGEQMLPAKSVLVTFDDAYQDFELHAFPVLAKLNIPAALFVPTGYPDSGKCFWWDTVYHALNSAPKGIDLQVGKGPPKQLKTDNLRAVFRELKAYLKSLPDETMQSEVDSIVQQVGVSKGDGCVMSWDSLLNVSTQGIDLVPHTCGHPLLTRISTEMAKQEVVESLETLKRRTGDVLPAFAYPSGFYNEAAEELLKDVGIEIGFTTVRGVNDLINCNPLRLRRINVGATTPDSLIRLQLCSASLKVQRNIGSTFPG